MGKFTIAVRETSVCRHAGDPVEGPLEPLNTIEYSDVRGHHGTLSWSPMMPRDVSLIFLIRVAFSRQGFGFPLVRPKRDYEN